MADTVTSKWEILDTTSIPASHHTLSVRLMILKTISRSLMLFKHLTYVLNILTHFTHQTRKGSFCFTLMLGAEGAENFIFSPWLHF